MFGSKYDLKMHVQNLEYHFPYKSEAPKPLLSTIFRNLTAILTAHISGMKRDIHKRASALQTIRGLQHRFETT